MGRLRRERRDAHRDVLGALRVRRAVAHPFALPGDQRLACSDFERPTFVLDPQAPLEHDRVFVERGPLARLSATQMREVDQAIREVLDLDLDVDAQRS